MASSAETWHLETLRSGDRKLHEDFVRQYYAPLFRWLRWLCGDLDEAVDLTQQAFAACWQSLDRAEPTLEAKVWLFGIARNVWRNSVRARRRRRHESGNPMVEVADTRGLSGLEVAITAERMSDVREAVAELKEDFREAVTLRYWADCSYAEISQTLSISPALARQRVFQGRLQLRQRLEPWSENTTNDECGGMP